MKASYLMLKMSSLPGEYSSNEVLFFLTSCLSTVNHDITYNGLQSTSSRQKEKAGAFLLSKYLVFSNYRKKRRNKKQDKKVNRESFLQKIDYVVSVWLSPLVHWVKLSARWKEKPIYHRKVEISEAMSPPLEIHLMQQNLQGQTLSLHPFLNLSIWPSMQVLREKSSVTGIITFWSVKYFPCLRSAFIKFTGGPSALLVFVLDLGSAEHRCPSALR